MSEVLFTTEALDALAKCGNVPAIKAAVQAYLTTLDVTSIGNLYALAKMNTPAELAALATEADGKNPAAATFVRVAHLSRLIADDAAKEAAKPPYELPVFSLAKDDEIYPLCAQMQKGFVLKNTKVSGWAVLGKKPAEYLYPKPETVARMLEKGLIVPAIGQPWSDGCSEYLLSAIGWRCMGVLYTDQSAAVELRVYEVAGDANRDTDRARKYRTVLADWRARQARRDTAPGWNRWSEFPLTLTDKVTGNGAQTVTVLFESGRPDAPDVFEFFGPVNEKGYHQQSQQQGSVTSQTVNQKAFDIASALAAEFAEAKRNGRKAVTAKPPKPPKPVAPTLKVLDDGDNPEELAALLGIV